MLYFVLPIVRPADPLCGYMAQWGQPIANRVHLLGYDMAIAIRGTRGACIFMLAAQRGMSEDEPSHKVSAFVSATAPGIRQLNIPGRPLSRSALLRKLRELGRNDFDAFRVAELDDRVRYPVYLRVPAATGGMSGLLNTRAELDRAIEDAVGAGIARERLLVTEFLDMGTDGIYRKYSAIKVGDEIIAHHIFFSREWVVRADTLMPVTREMVAEEAEFQRTNPHREAVAAAFQLAQTDFGRIDYGVKDGKVQVWEINTNPIFLQPRSYYKPMQMPNKEWLATTLNEALRKLSRWRATLVPGPTDASEVPLGIH